MRKPAAHASSRLGAVTLTRLAWPWTGTSYWCHGEGVFVTGVVTADAGAATVMADAATSAPPAAAAYDLALILAPVLGEDAFALAHQVSPRKPLSVLGLGGVSVNSILEVWRYRVRSFPIWRTADDQWMCRVAADGAPMRAARSTPRPEQRSDAEVIAESRDEPEAFAELFDR